MKEKNIKTKQINEAVVTNAIESLSSIKLTKVAGNYVRPEVKVYDADPDKAMLKAQEIMDKLIKKYGDEK
jgi:hypothetical protein